ncbi:MAG: hypothetical protein EA416_17800 [Trueperaceae bacterium]|nr:MAG: hypothetical protein EA416_17800 [Trueperaceae bacterium]
MTEHDSNDPLARDIERINVLRDQGRLTGAEADRLIAVLRGAAPDAEIDAEAGATTDVAPTLADEPAVEAPQATMPPERPTPPTQPTPPTEPAPATPPVAQASHPRDDLGVPWLITEMLAADLVVEAKPGIDAPTLRKPVEDATLEREGDGWRLRYRTEWSNWGIFGSGRGAPARIEVDVPEGMGVELDVKAGDVTVRGVAHVRGRMLAGDLTIDGASFVDVDKKAGDFEARIRPTAGKQRLVAKAGDLDVVLLPGSDVRVSATVKVGDLRIRGDGFKGSRESQGIGHRQSFTLGAGSAELELRLAAGSMTLKTEA